MTYGLHLALGAIRGRPLLRLTALDLQRPVFAGWNLADDPAVFGGGAA